MGKNLSFPRDFIADTSCDYFLMSSYIVKLLILNYWQNPCVGSKMGIMKAAMIEKVKQKPLHLSTPARKVNKSQANIGKICRD